jgi:RNA polymerase subunit RPABC4/transcription elongation factor Spt4
MKKVELKPLICQNCGGHIDRDTMRCPFCDTQYEKTHNDMPINFVVERPGVHKIRAEVKMPYEFELRDPERATEYAMDNLRQGIADGLLDYMKICTEKNPMTMCSIIRGEVRVLDPYFSDYERNF